MNDDDEVLRYRFGACFFYLPSKTQALLSTSSQDTRRERRTASAELREEDAERQG